MSKARKTIKSSAKCPSRRRSAKATPVKQKALAPDRPKSSRSRKSESPPDTGLNASGPRSELNGDKESAAAEIYRARMRLVGGLLNDTFDSVETPDADQVKGGSDGDQDLVHRVGRGAYMQIMGQVFSMLFDLSQAISTDELVKLSRIVAEQRRAEIAARKVEIGSRAGKRRRGKLDSKTGAGRLPESFGDIVRQVYGVSISDSSGQSNGRGGDGSSD